MKKTIMTKVCALAGAVSLLAASNVFAGFDGTLNFGSAGPYQNGGGGEFNVTTSGLGSFVTFCIEENETISLPSGPYNYKINTGSVKGGVSGATTTDPNTLLPMDNISIGTAWLYSQFRAGILTKANGTGSYYDAATRFANAGDLQNAIWFLEGEGGANNGYVSLAQQFAGSGNLTLAQAEADSLGAYGVVALNLFTGGSDTPQDPGSVHQDQLAIVPEASTMIAGALLLLPLGASTLRIVRKNRGA
jgi:hypothetical protein